MAEANANFAPRDIIRLLYRRRYLFVLCASLFAILVLLAAPRVVTKKYTSSATFERRSDVASEQETKRGSESFDTIKRTLTQDIVDPVAMENLVDDLGLTQGLPRDVEGMLTPESERARRQLMSQLRSGVSVKFDVRSANVDVVRVSFTGGDPVLVQQVPDALIKIYINNVSKRITKRLTASRDFLERRVRLAEQKLEEIQNKKINFEEEHAGLTLESPMLLLQRMQEAKAQLDANEQRLESSKKKYARLMAARKQSKDKTEPSELRYGPNPELARLGRDLQEYREQLETATTLDHMTEKHPIVKALRASIKLVEGRIQRLPKEVVLETIYSTSQGMESYAAQVAAVQAEIEATESRIQYFQSRVNGYEKMQANFAPVRREYAKLLGQFELDQKETDSWRNRFREVEMVLAADKAKQRTHLGTVRRAERQYIPSSPTLAKVFGAAFLGGLAFAGALVFLLYKLDRTISSPEDAAEYFNVPIHGVISEIVPASVRRRRRMFQWVIAPAIGMVLLAVIVLSSYNTKLWLQDPEKFSEWQASPVEFILNKISHIGENHSANY